MATKDTPVTIYMPAKTAQLLKKLADADDRSVSSVALRIINEHFENMQMERLGLSVKPDRRRA